MNGEGKLMIENPLISLFSYDVKYKNPYGVESEARIFLKNPTKLKEIKSLTS